MPAHFCIHPIYHRVCAVQCHTQPSVSWPTDTAVTCLLYLQNCGQPTPKLALLRRKSSLGIAALGNSTCSSTHTHAHSRSLTHTQPARRACAETERCPTKTNRRRRACSFSALIAQRPSPYITRPTSLLVCVCACVCVCRGGGDLLLLLTYYLRQPHTACCCVVHLRCSCMAWLLRLRTMPGQPATHHASRPSWQPTSDSLTASLLT